jgi:hypothetical protein
MLLLKPLLLQHLLFIIVEAPVAVAIEVADAVLLLLML